MLDCVYFSIRACWDIQRVCLCIIQKTVSFPTCCFVVLLLYFFHFGLQLSLIKQLVYLANVIEWNLNGCFQSSPFLADHDFSDPKFYYGGGQEFIFVFALFKGIEFIYPFLISTCDSPLVSACVYTYVLISTCILQSTFIDWDLWITSDFQLQNSTCLIKWHFSFLKFLLECSWFTMSFVSDVQQNDSYIYICTHSDIHICIYIKIFFSF